MRASRLLSIQMLLETRGRMSAAALAQALQVSVRTLHRDIDELTSAGVPVYAERGRAGGFQLLPGWKPRLTGFTPGEAQAVFLTGLAGPAAELGLGEQVRSAQLKLLAALPPDWRGRARQVSARLHLDPVEWYREADPAPFLSLAATAVWDGRQLALAYASWSRTSRTTVHPLGLVLKAGAWYLVATRGGKVRTWRVASIVDAAMLDEPVTRPPGFDLAESWRQSVLHFEAGLHTGQATVLASRKGLAALRRISAAVARAVDAAPAAAEPGRTRLRIPIESIDLAAGQLLMLAPDVEAVAPPALREAVRARARAAARLHAGAVA